MQFYPVKNQNFYEEEGVGDVLNVFFTFKVGQLIKRGACFRNQKKIDIPFLISK